MRYDAIVFDLGNTLLPWGDAENLAVFRALEETVTRALGPVDGFRERVLALRERVAARRYTTMEEATVAEFVEAFTGGGAPAGLVDAVAETVETAFLGAARIPAPVRPLLERLGGHRPLAVLSNFFLTSPVERLLRREGLMDLFVHVEVSATGGLMKPHPAPFETVRERLGTSWERTLMVGDDFWADIVGGHRAGFLTALTHEHRQDVTSDPRAPEVRADRVLASLDELAD